MKQEERDRESQGVHFVKKTEGKEGKSYRERERERDRATEERGIEKVLTIATETLQIFFKWPCLQFL